jgi:hypothetical protein
MTPQDVALAYAGHSRRDGSGRRGHRSIVLHVRLDEVASSECGKKRQLASHDCRSDDPCESLGVGTWVGRMGTCYTEHLEHGSLRRQDRSTTDSADLDGRHGDGHEEILPVVRPVD